MRATAWRKSSFSGEAGSNCVEVGFASGGAAVRDSKNVAGPHLVFGTGAWREFVQQRAGAVR
jgi:hypothetical protein